ncbi:nucleosome assembly protein [Elsinoe australis]|uniref:Nucleosome assembly protein n=1 Tax=Elsinoe australis TaxID=40998 RepID=A0A4U7B9V3_9PEZI|nr:nucleosome assembly protein [Elsinoe australis]
MATSSAEEADPVTYEELADIEREFDDLDVEIIRKQYLLSKDLYAKRKTVVSKIPKFWPLVLEAAPPEIDRYIQPSDSEVFAECLTGITVDRFEITADEGNANGSMTGDPRSVSITFEFSENEWFKDTALEKKFWWRRANDGWTGLVSEPVRVHWKKGKDPTKGLMDGAIRLWEARKKAGDMRKRDLPEFDHMAKITETWNGDNTTFFTWFAFVSSRRWVSEEESRNAVEAEAARRKEVRTGTEKPKVGLPEDDQLESQVEAHEDGDGLATVIAEDLWPSAIRYFTQAQESADLSDEEFEEDEEDEEGQPEDGEINLRGLVAQGGEMSDVSDADEPPRKKKKA